MCCTCCPVGRRPRLQCCHHQFGKKIHSFLEDLLPNTAVKPDHLEAPELDLLMIWVGTLRHLNIQIGSKPGTYTGRILLIYLLPHSLSLLDGHYVTLLLQRIGASDWRRGFNSIFRWSFRSLQSPNVRQLEFELTWVSVCAFILDWRLDPKDVGLGYSRACSHTDRVYPIIFVTSLLRA